MRGQHVDLAERLYEHYFGRLPSVIAEAQSLVRQSNDDFIGSLYAVLAGQYVSTNLVPSAFDKGLGSEVRKALVIEANEDLSESVVCAFAGLYKSAFHSLRSYLDLSLLALAAPLMDKKSLADWVRGRAPTPPFENTIKLLLTHPRLKVLDDALGFKEQVLDIYRSKLSAITHTRGLEDRYTRLPSGYDVRTRILGNFDRQLFAAWYNLCIECVRAVSAALAVMFPLGFQPLPLADKFSPGEQPSDFDYPHTGVLNESEGDKFRQMFDVKTREVLQRISDGDAETRLLVQALEARPLADSQT